MSLTAEHVFAISLHVIFEQGGGAIPQSFAGPPTHMPFMSHVSFVVQNLPSSQVAPMSGT